MVDWFEKLSSKRSLSDDVASLLERNGFAILSDVVSGERLVALTKAYAAAEASALEPDKRIGSTSTRVSNFVNRGKQFDEIYLLPQLLDACCRIIGRPFKLSSFHSRTLHPHAVDQGLHVDVERGSSDFPLLGFILMIDAFRADNGATRFVPGSHRWMRDVIDENESVLGCGSAGSLLIYSGSTWHGHSANTTNHPRRSLQGAFIPREGKSATDFKSGMTDETRDRLSPLARYLLEVGS